MKPFTLWRSVFWAVLAGSLFAVTASGHIHVTGTSAYPADHNNVQTAITNASPGETVVLHGAFDFGADGGIDILQPNITLEGTGATITGQGKPSPALGFPCLITVGAVGCKISGLTITCTRSVGWSGGVAVRTLSNNPSDNPVIIENNIIAVYPPVPDAPQPITGRAYAVRILETGCPIRILGNTLSGNYGVYAIPNSGDVLISGNTITSRNYGMYVMQNTRDCIVTDNNVYGNSNSNAIHVCTTPGNGKVLISRNRTIGARFGINVHSLGMTSREVPAEISDNYSEQTTALPTGYFALGLWGYANNSPLNIINNVIRVIADRPEDHPTAGQLGMYLYSWDPRNGLDQDNGPVLIKGNDIEIRYPMPDVPDYTLQASSIFLGDGGAGLSNVTVEGNRLSGSVMDGIVRFWYGKNTVIAGNDLSGLRSWEAQLWLVGGQTVVKDNVFGFSNHIPGYSWGVLLGSAMLAPEYQPQPPFPVPYPTENCVLTGNDYRRTELPGWGKGSGCIVLQSFADVGGYGTEIRNNLVAESGRFPVGTGGVMMQVYENKTASGLVHDNRIVGLPAIGLTDPGIGQRLKEIGGRSAHMMAAQDETLEKKGGGEENGFLQVPGAASPQSPAEAIIPALPATSELLGNYPNPFNPSTTIRYALARNSQVTLTVYNALGQEVAILEQGQKEAGYHQVTFHATGLASGVYFCRLQTGDYVAAKKLLLMR